MSYDLKDVKVKAAGYWPAILNRVGGVDDDFLTTSHGPCPKCGGTDRWRVFDDFADSGGAICNQCGRGQGGKGMGDGIQVMQWLLGVGFPDAIQKVGNFLGVQPAKKKEAKKRRDPAEDIEVMQTQELVLRQFCKAKSLSPKAIERLGGVQARYKKHIVFVFPVMGEDDSDPVGFSLYDAYGGNLPVWNDKTKNYNWVKVKTIKR